MPEIKFQHVVSVSSEDKNFPADNLLKSGGYHKWKTATAGEKNATVILQFQKSSKVNNIHIGNEGSAFIEVLVGKSSSSADDFQVLLVASSFMNPMEARNGQNLNRVRMFSSDQLSKAACDQKWDRVKIVCTQPFNKTSAYGLSFIKFQEGEDTSAPTKSPQKQESLSKFGIFKVKEDDSSSSITTGTIFAKNKERKEAAPLTGAAAVRAAAKAADELLPVDPPKPEREEKPSTSKPQPTKQRSEREDKPSTSNKHKLEKMSEPKPKTKPSVGRQLSSSSSDSAPRAKKAKATPPSRKQKEETKKKKSKPLEKLMEKVVFVMSGYQNPKRGQLRDMALEMGATYKPDWTKHCTHLICAFSQTPKYNQVLDKGRIVNESWIKESYKKKELQPWRKYSLVDSLKRPDVPSSESSSEEEEEEEEYDDDDDEKAPTPKKSPAKSPAKKGAITYDSSDGDTEDEISRVRNPSPKKSPAKKSPTKDPYNVPTDEDDDDDDATDEEPMEVVESTELPKLPDFFSKKTFLLYGTYDAKDRRFLKRLIVAYNGKMEEYMSDKVTHVLSSSAWDKNFDKALEDNSDLQFVKPEWVYSCDQQQKLIPYQSFQIVPVSG